MEEFFYDNSGIFFAVSPYKHMLWVPVRGASLKRF